MFRHETSVDPTLSFFVPLPKRDFSSVERKKYWSHHNSNNFNSSKYIKPNFSLFFVFCFFPFAILLRFNQYWLDSTVDLVLTTDSLLLPLAFSLFTSTISLSLSLSRVWLFLLSSLSSSPFSSPFLLHFPQTLKVTYSSLWFESFLVSWIVTLYSNLHFYCLIFEGFLDWIDQKPIFIKLLSFYFNLSAFELAILQEMRSML